MSNAPHAEEFPAMTTTPEVPEYLRPVLDAYGAALDAHGQTYGETPACECGREFGTRNGVGLHIAAAHKRAEREYTAAAATARYRLRASAIEQEAAARLAAPPVDAAVETLLDEVEARADAEHAADEEQRALDAVEQDVPPVSADADRVTLPIRARDIRPGDLVVDASGERQYAAFDTQTAGPDGSHVRIWTAITDQERGLAPRLMLDGDRELLVSRPAPAGGDDATVIPPSDGFRAHVNTTARCLACGQLITVNEDGDTECGGAGEGVCDAVAEGDAGPIEDSHHDAADLAHDALLGWQLAHETA